jgi:hypothetical protein
VNLRRTAGRPHGLARRSGRAAGLALIAVGLLATPALAADPVFGTPTISASFGQDVQISQPVQSSEPLRRVELLLRYADDQAPLVVELPPPAVSGQAVLLHTLSGSDGHILPNTPLEARWRITPEDGSPVVGPAVRTILDDDRFDWKTAEGDVVRVHWYEGSEAFGQRALRIGEQAVADTAALLGVTEDEPVDFFIYADQDAFYDALGPGTRENVGGQANADIRTLFALIGPGEIDDPWVGVVVPHELVHLVVDTTVSNPYHFPPRWLNEGLAVYLSQGYDGSDRAAVNAAAASGSLLPLDGLDGQFPTSAARFFLAYAESVSAVDYLIRTHGQDALVALIASYADGRTDDEAFQAAIGMDVAAFDAAWLADLDTAPPVRHGPQPAPPGPLPAAWTAGGTATSGPGSSAGAAPSPAASAPGDGFSGPDAPDVGGTTLVVLTIALVGAVFVGILVLRRGRRTGDES